MYLDFYGFKEKPFTLSPNPKYLFYSHRHKEALAQIIYAATQQYGYMVLTGEVGTGKTTLINAMLKCLPKEFLIAKIYHTVLSPKGLIQNICKEFGIEFANRTMAELVFELQEYLKWSFHAGKKSILILDEAQNLRQDILEEIRLLSNFEAMHEKYLQILLVGQPELEVNLRHANLHQLQERIGLKYRLEKLNREETRDYIDHRITVAGCKYVGKLFTEGAMDKIYTISRGVPRRINIICDQALLMGYANNKREINRRIIAKIEAQGRLDETLGIRTKEREASATKLNSHGSYSDEYSKSDVMAATTEKFGVKQNVSKEKNGKLNYSRFEKLMGRFLIDNELLVFKKPILTKVLYASLLMFMVFFLACLVAILFAQKLGILIIN